MIDTFYKLQFCHILYMCFPTFLTGYPKSHSDVGSLPPPLLITHEEHFSQKCPFISAAHPLTGNK